VTCRALGPDVTFLAGAHQNSGDSHTTRGEPDVTFLAVFGPEDPRCDAAGVLYLVVFIALIPRCDRSGVHRDLTVIDVTSECSLMSVTSAQRTNVVGFPKAGELIEITGAHALTSSDRAILNLLYQNAHDSGRMTEENAEWEIPVSSLGYTRHESNDHVRLCLLRLMRVVVQVPRFDAKTGEPRIILTPLFEFFDLSANTGKANATVRYGVPKKLRPVLAASQRWGRIKAEVVCSMTSKYAMALYELVQLRSGLDRCVETFTISRFRDLLGVPPGKLNRGPDFERRVIGPAMLEVNGLSDMSVSISLERKHARAPVTGVVLAWWKKEGDEFREAMQERNRSKVGRMARLRSETEDARVVTTALVAPAGSRARL
jgi:Initiator Replication protein